jgi:hypothetical protein
VPARWLAIAIVLALLPTVELVEQGAHVIEHALHHDAVDHDAHHDDHDPAEEHGCTELVHVCGGHHGFGVTPTLRAPVTVERQLAAVDPLAPSDLHDLAAPEPPHRPPIG